MARGLLVSHPEVVIDPAVPVPQWGLSEVGAARMRGFAERVAPGIGAVWSSAETKAIEAAEILSAACGVPKQVDDALGENDRSATGYLAKAEFEAMADAFFANPQTSVRGWERAIDAQRRIVSAVDRVLAATPAGKDVAIVAHGGVGTLLLCHFLGAPISRTRDQRSQGNVWTFDLATRKVLSEWTPLEAFGG
jgi:broad specificity phosphatase PhoE